jgi:hypothetical protein
MPPGRIINLSLRPRASQLAILGFSMVCHSFALGSIFNSYSILAESAVDIRFCHEIKAIIAFSFLAWILRNTFALSVHACL